jgi:glyoxylase-like metal-dependent hydrolase (beta-lactamase superfamily II)
MSELELYAFTCGIFQSTKSFFVAGDGDDIVRSPVPAYLIDHPKGLALFDTGLNLRHRRAAGAELRADEQGFDMEDTSDIGARLIAIGIDPGKVRWIINSHLHADHCGGNASIPNATLIIQSAELAAARACDQPLLYNPADYDLGHSILPLSGEHDLYGDGSVTIFPTPGHTPGHQSVRVRLKDGDVVLTADCCYLKRNLDELVVPALNVDVEASMQTLKMLRRLRDSGTRIFYGHDRTFWTTVPQGVAIR